MKRSTTIALSIFILLIALAIPLYYFTRPDNTQPNGSLQVEGNVNKPVSFTLDQLQSLSSVTLQATVSSSSHTEDNGVFNYTGVPLKDLLSEAQISGNATTIYIQASDGYGTTITLQEAQNQNTFIAYQKDGQLLTKLKDGGEGPLRLIIGSDQYAQRWVRGVVSLDVS